LKQELTLDECREIVSDYEIKDEEVLKKVKHLYLRQDTTKGERVAAVTCTFGTSTVCLLSSHVCWRGTGQ
jgi:hypothetical protein